MNTERLVVYQWWGERIDSFLASHYDMSRHFFHHLFKKKSVSVNGRRVKKSYKLKAWDTIVCDSRERFDDPWLLLESPRIEINVVYENDDYMIIDKPAGVLSHPNSVWDVSQPNVVWWLAHRCQGLPSSGHFIRAGLIHRLDKETSGLMILVKTEHALSHFRDLFARKSEAETIEEKEAVPLKKYYTATCVVWQKGRLTLDQREKEGFPVLIDADVTPRTPHPVTKRGLTKVLACQRLDAKRARLSLEILTWRTHQIRVHLSERWLPLVGDYVYGEENGQAMQLRASKLCFVWDGEELVYMK